MIFAPPMNAISSDFQVAWAKTENSISMNFLDRSMRPLGFGTPWNDIETRGKLLHESLGSLRRIFDQRFLRKGLIYEALEFFAVSGASAFATAPLNALFTMVWDHILPSRTAWITLQSEATLELRKLEARERISLSKEETRRAEIARDIVAEKEITTREAI